MPICCMTLVNKDNNNNVASSTPRHERGFELTTLVVIGTDCIGSCKSNYHTNMTTLTMTDRKWKKISNQ